MSLVPRNLSATAPALAAAATALWLIAPLAQAAATPLAPGVYQGMVFEWPVVVEIRAVEADGTLRGSATYYPTQMQQQYGRDVSRSAAFKSHPGADGLPEVTFQNGNQFSGLQACGNDLCALFHFGFVPNNHQLGTYDAWRSVRLVRQGP